MQAHYEGDDNRDIIMLEAINIIQESGSLCICTLRNLPETETDKK